MPTKKNKKTLQLCKGSVEVQDVKQHEMVKSLKCLGFTNVSGQAKNVLPPLGISTVGKGKERACSSVNVMLQLPQEYA